MRKITKAASSASLSSSSTEEEAFSGGEVETMPPLKTDTEAADEAYLTANLATFES
jgi:hypothetical protein